MSTQPGQSIQIAPEDEVRERFEQETATHRMRVLRDDGLYRHLRFMAPGTWCYGYDLVTWPGHLAIAGDCGDYTFARVTDMFEFFRSDNGRINPHYWSEKLTNPGMREGTRRFDKSAFRPRVMAWYEEHCESYGDEGGVLLRALEEQLFEWHEPPFNGFEAVSMLSDFEHNGIRIEESYEWDLDRWDWQFLWCCWGIVQGIAQYDWARSYR